MKRSPEVLDGLAVRQDNLGWGVFHAESGLAAVRGLRQRRFADQARADMLATGVDFTRPARDVQKDRARWSEVYYRWQRRASATDLDPDTWEFYPKHARYGQVIPSAAQAAAWRDAPAAAGRTS